MSPAPEPRGKAALFSAGPVPGTGAGHRPAGGGAGARGGVFSAGAGERSWTVACRSCRAETPTTALELLRLVLRPGALWWPLSSHPHRLACPACGDATWCRIGWRAPRRR